MKIYNYSPTTKEFLSITDASLDPLETAASGKNVYLIPAHATDVAPPETGVNEIAIFNGKGWDILPDFRGVIYWLTDRTKLIIESIGEEVPGGAFLEVPPLTPEETAAAQAEADRIAAKAQAFIDNLPSWELVSSAVDNIANLADAKVFLNKLARVVYWLAKNKAD